eukprot:GEMP01028023.1.p1 GENE.GEMP01028023.1~~GEMP01028023.1.p1  ORF type:complete len:186 (+),score=29.81 GEMP01028023.1:157-714(+)
MVDRMTIDNRINAVMCEQQRKESRFLSGCFDRNFASLSPPKTSHPARELLPAQETRKEMQKSSSSYFPKETRKEMRKSSSSYFLEQMMVFCMANRERPGTRELLYNGVSAIGGGRASYLKRRVQKYGPRDRYLQPMTETHTVGWRRPTSPHRMSPFSKRPIARVEFFRDSGVRTYLDVPQRRNEQ